MAESPSLLLFFSSVDKLSPIFWMRSLGDKVDAKTADFCVVCPTKKSESKRLIPEVDDSMIGSPRKTSFESLASFGNVWLTGSPKNFSLDVVV